MLPHLVPAETYRLSRLSHKYTWDNWDTLLFGTHETNNCQHGRTWVAHCVTSSHIMQQEQHLYVVSLLLNLIISLNLNALIIWVLNATDNMTTRWSTLSTIFK